MAILVELFLWPLPYLEGPDDSRYLSLAPPDHSRCSLWPPGDTNLAGSCIYQQLWSCQQILVARHVVSQSGNPKGPHTLLTLYP